MMRREYVTYEYATDVSRDSATRCRGNTKATVIVRDIDQKQQFLEGDRDRFQRLRDMLDQLLQDWE